MAAVLRIRFRSEESLHDCMANDSGLYLSARPSDEPCANIILSDEEILAAQVEESIEFLAKEAEYLKRLRSDVMEWCLDFAYHWYPSKTAYAQAEFSPDLMGHLARLGIELQVSVYPCADEAAGESI